MTAGMVSVPAIIPLKPPGLGATGSRKWSVDTNTMIEMQSSTKKCLIFYTLNGTKPDPFKKIGEKTTYHYSKPITLSPGKKTVKAIAVLSDGTRESNVNTKVFQVAAAAKVTSDDENGTTSKMNTTWENQMLSDDEEDEEISRYDSRMFKNVAKSSVDKLSTHEKHSPVRRVMMDTYSTFDGQEREDDLYFSCTNCEAPRPRDPYARFCNECNAILPPAPGKYRSPGQFKQSTEHESSVNSSNRGRKSCQNCGLNNPKTAIECLVCDAPLGGPISKLQKAERTAAEQPSEDFIVCPYCTRVNCGNARFCDWCGEQSNSRSRTVACQRCSTENIVTSNFCCSCGEEVKTPTRKSYESKLSQGNMTIKAKRYSLNDSVDDKMKLLTKLTEEDSPTWNKIEFEPVTRKETKNISVQVGESMIQQKSNKRGTKPSAGKGYWRQQVDYISQHLKVYTQNNASFRDEVSAEALSQLVSASVYANGDDKSEIVLRMIFSLHGKDQKKTKKLKTINAGETMLNALAEQQSSSKSRPSSGTSRPPSGTSRPSSGKLRKTSADYSDRSNMSQPSSRPSSGRKKKLSQKTLEKEKLDLFMSKLSEDTKRLLHIIKSQNEPDFEKVEELLDSDDIDLNASDENGTPFLKLSVLNKQFDLIPLLVSAGSDIDAVSGVKLNTALHEAVTLGVSGKLGIELLLENDASTSIKDKKGNTAHDIAVDSGHESVLNLFNKHTSKELLKDVMKL